MTGKGKSAKSKGNYPELSEYESWHVNGCFVTKSTKAKFWTKVQIIKISQKLQCMKFQSNSGKFGIADAKSTSSKSSATFKGRNFIKI